MADIKILIVEDEALVAEEIASRLEKMGYSVVAIVASGEDAISAAEMAQPNLVLMDIMLQGEIGGVEAAKQIYRELKIPVVYLTAYADEDTLQQAKLTSPFGYILKPFRERELRANIEIALSRYQTEVEVQKTLISARSLQQETQARSELKSQYFSMASHDFRNSLSSINVAAHLLQNRARQLTEEQEQHCLQHIQEAVERMNQLLKEALTLYRADFGKLQCHPVFLDVVTFCRNLVEVLQLTAGDRYKLIFSNQGDCSVAYLDEKLLWHLLNNLISNAIKHSFRSGIVSLAIKRQEGEICFQVRDRGIGIPPEQQKLLFEPYQRADNTGNIPGPGLELAIVKWCVDLHGGQMTVESEVGRGTTFTVILPLKLPPDYSRL